MKCVAGLDEIVEADLSLLNQEFKLHVSDSGPGSSCISLLLLHFFPFSTRFY